MAENWLELSPTCTEEEEFQLNSFMKEQSELQAMEQEEYLEFLAELENDYHRLSDEEVEEMESWID